MSMHGSRPEDQLNQHVDDLLRGRLMTAPDAAEQLSPETAGLLAVAGLLAEAMGGETPDPAARAAGLEQLLTAARKPQQARILLFPTLAHRDGHVPQSAGRAPRRNIR